MKQLIYLFAAFGAAGFLTSCGVILGYKQPKFLNDKKIIHYGNQIKIPASESYKLDTSYATRLVTSYDKKQYEIELKNHTQPLQALYFKNQTKQLQSFYINCYVSDGNGLNLNWNTDGRLDQFPPKQQAPVDSILPLDSLLNFLLPISIELNRTELEQYDYVVIVFWNYFLQKSSKGLIEQVRKNVALSSDKKVKVIYVNNDNFFSKYSN